MVVMMVSTLTNIDSEIKSSDAGDVLSGVFLGRKVVVVLILMITMMPGYSIHECPRD